MRCAHIFTSNILYNLLMKMTVWSRCAPCLTANADTLEQGDTVGITSLVSGWFINIHPLASYVHEYINWYDSATRFTSLLCGYTWGTGVRVKHSCVRLARVSHAYSQHIVSNHWIPGRASITQYLWPSVFFPTKTITRNTKLSCYYS